ncbi:MAG: hypothetical protein EOO48_09375 [Flavobacterium sp.]|nr:MAG: hypothetical protein EOO48_09375 [Flavobacterium sp.]
MKALSLIVSLAVFLVAGYYFVSDFSFSAESNHLIYMSLLVVLMMICIIGILINMPIIHRERRKMKVFVYDRFTRKAVKSKKFEMNFETS